MTVECWRVFNGSFVTLVNFKSRTKYCADNFGGWQTGAKDPVLEKKLNLKTKIETKNKTAFQT